MGPICVKARSFSSVAKEKGVNHFGNNWGNQFLREEPLESPGRELSWEEVRRRFGGVKINSPKLVGILVRSYGLDQAHSNSI